LLCPAGLLPAGVTNLGEGRGGTIGKGQSRTFGPQRKTRDAGDSLLHLEKQVASLINLFEIARDFNECLDLKETAQILYKKVLPELAFEQAELILLTPDTNPPAILRAYLISSLGVEEKTSFAPEAPEQPWLQKALAAKSFVSSDRLWLFPLILETEFNGLFMVQGSSKEDLAKFEVLASQLSLQVRKIRLYEMVRELSILDGLTGVFVRRHFLERFEEEIRRALKHHFPLSVLMLDIDHFKRYNDEFGHLVGDATLKEVARLIRASVRNVDIVARYGGEEFAVVIPETREERALEVAERIRSAVARRAFRVYDEETKVTVSLGIAVFPQDLSVSPSANYDPNFLFELLQKADQALYRAKEEGRNRVISYRTLGYQSY
jgi:diguanylate cyclase (GGDEF)-like protein